MHLTAAHKDCCSECLTLVWRNGDQPCETQQQRSQSKAEWVKVDYCISKELRFSYPFASSRFVLCEEHTVCLVVKQISLECF